MLRSRALGMLALAIAATSGPADGQTTPPVARDRAASSPAAARAMPGRLAPTPVDPYPLHAAGWGPPAGGRRFVSRWAEDWTGMRAAGTAPSLKAVPLGGEASLTVSAEARLHLAGYDNGQLTLGDDFRQTRFRGVLGAELRLNASVRLYGEVGTGQVEGRRGAAAPNFQNDASLQQLFVDARGQLGATLAGVMVGRQEFADGPRQLLSVSDGPNLHRTWNGVRLYAHGRTFRLGAFDLRGTRLGRRLFDEGVDRGERLRGLNASLVVAPGPDGTNVYLDPFWIHSERAVARAGDAGRDDRHTYGARVWGRRRALAVDWTLARQTGRSASRPVDAWGLFGVHTLALARGGWRPRLTARLDVASDGFHHLYASSNYLGEGQFLSLGNLLMVTPGALVSPTPRTTASVEYGLARRLAEGGAVYAGGMRPYAGTREVPGHAIGGLLRVVGSWSAGERITLHANYERLHAGRVLARASLPAGGYGYVGASYRY
jgi:hypothetical protein